MTATIYDGHGRPVADIDGAELVPRPNTPSTDEIAGWLKDGVPALKGRKTGAEIAEEWGVVRPDEPGFGLAVLEAVERMGWTIGGVQGRRR